MLMVSIRLVLIGLLAVEAAGCSAHKLGGGNAPAHPEVAGLCLAATECPGDVTGQAPAVDYDGYPANTGSDGKGRLEGLWIGDPKSPVTAVVFHGIAETLAKPTSVCFGAALAEQGMYVFLAEYRGYAGDGSAITEAGLFQDGRDALTFVAGKTAKPIVLIGYSLGTGIATELAKEAQPTGQLSALAERVRALVLIAPFTSLPAVSKLHLPISMFYAAEGTFANEDALPHVTVPTYVLSSSADDVVEMLPAELVKGVGSAHPCLQHREVQGRAHPVLRCGLGVHVGAWVQQALHGCPSLGSDGYLNISKTCPTSDGAYKCSEKK